jgi:hypothetical protein
MSQSAPPAPFASQRKRIAQMVEAAAPFIAVEQAIADSLLPPEQKTELWTLAWSLLGPQRQAHLGRSQPFRKGRVGHRVRAI